MPSLCRSHMLQLLKPQARRERRQTQSPNVSKKWRAAKKTTTSHQLRASLPSLKLTLFTNPTLKRFLLPPSITLYSAHEKLFEINKGKCFFSFFFFYISHIYCSWKISHLAFTFFFGDQFFWTSAPSSLRSLRIAHFKLINNVEFLAEFVSCCPGLKYNLRGQLYLPSGWCLFHVILVYIANEQAFHT